MLDRLKLQRSFETKYIPEPNSGCWLWIGATNARGRGSVGLPGTRKTVTAHRLSYLLFRGPVPEGLHVCHICDMPLCVNPEHLVLGTHQDNMDQCKARGRKAKGFRLPRTKLTLEQIAVIIADTRPQQMIADEYGIHNSYVSQLKSGKRVRC